MEITILGYLNDMSFKLLLLKKIMKRAIWEMGIEKGGKMGGRKRIKCSAMLFYKK